MWVNHPQGLKSPFDYVGYNYEKQTLRLRVRGLPGSTGPGLDYFNVPYEVFRKFPHASQAAYLYYLSYVARRFPQKLVTYEQGVVDDPQFGQ